MRKLKNTAVMLLALVLLLQTFSTVSPVDAHFQQPASYNHQVNNVLQNGGFETVTGSASDYWYAWGAAYAVDSAVYKDGSKSITCSNSTATAQCGAYQSLVLNRSDTYPIRISGWSKSSNASGAKNTDYALYADITYQDNTTLFGEALGFETGTHDWEYTEFYIDPEKPVKIVTLYVLFRNKTGQVWFDNIKVEEVQANLLQDNSFSLSSGGVFTHWGTHGNGYTVAGTEGRGGGSAAKMSAATPNQTYGVFQHKELNRTYTRPLLVTGWSKATGVGGSTNADYSLYADILYYDGTAQWGLNMPFDTGTHDWEMKQIYFDPVKPVKSITVYGLFRNHTGTVLFDNISVEELLNESPSVKAMNKLNSSGMGVELLVNGSYESVTGSAFDNWGTFESYGIDPNGGRNGSKAVVLENTADNESKSLYQTLYLNNSDPLLIISGWSKAAATSGVAGNAGVTGDPDNGYALYMDIFYTDGTSKYAVTVPFSTGAHDWQYRELYYYPEKPVATLSFYAMMRGKVGKVWFDDLSVRKMTTEAVSFEDALVEPLAVPAQTSAMTVTTSNGLSLSLGNHSVTSVNLDGNVISNSAIPSGFLVRDHAAKSDVYYFNKVPHSNPNKFKGRADDLGLEIDADFTAVAEGIKVSGRLTDTKEIDRAVSLTFALPVDADNWKWGDYIRSAQTIQTGQAGHVFTNSDPVDFETGAMSIYPISAIYDEQGNKSLSMGLDYGKPAHYRLDYNGGTKQLLITFEFGLAPDTANFPSSADFSFVIYRFDADWGFRSAFDQYTKLFPEHYTVRIQDQGIWMPFKPIGALPDWQDFGFKFKEGDDDAADTLFSNQNDILVFHYEELGSWWQPLDPEEDKTIANAIAVRDAEALNGDEKSQMGQSAAMLNSAGSPYLRWVDVPWNSGALWMINANPDLPGTTNGYKIYYSEEKLEDRYDTPPSAPKTNGEYLDTLDGWPYAMNFNRAHFPYAIAPLTFSKLNYKPAVHRGFTNWEATKRIADRMHSMDNFTMANGTPHSYSIYTPWLDAMGIERNWLGASDSFAPDGDEILSKYRTLAYQKPFLMLQNTDFSKFSYEHMKKYMQRSLFYGIFPSAFSPNASNTSNYWVACDSMPGCVEYFERDRDLFVQYVPVIKEVAEAGWEPLTYAESSNASILVERYGRGSAVYLTLMNESTTTNSAVISFAPGSLGINGSPSATEMLSGSPVAITNNTFAVSINPGEVKVVKIVS